MVKVDSNATASMDSIWPLITMATSSGRPCYKKKDDCPKGHEMEPCKMTTGETGRMCKQCGSLSFQPNTNRFGDQCRMRKTCSKYRMKYKEFGSTTDDAKCECEDGYHFENEDQRACVPNKVCGRGYGQGLFGVCEKCIDKHMWSNTEDTFSRCKPLRKYVRGCDWRNGAYGFCDQCRSRSACAISAVSRRIWLYTDCELICGCDWRNGAYKFCDQCRLRSACASSVCCEKESRCTVVKSNGTYDNRCGPVVSDVSDCDSIVYPPAPSQSSTMSTGTIALAIIGGVAGVAILLLLLFCFIRRRQEAKRASRITKEELDSLLQDMIKRSKKDELYCKKVLTVAQKEIEDRIDRQIWMLPQELFRNHTELAKYEDMVNKYKDKQHKFAINGYLQDWRSWRGDTSEAVDDLMKCLVTVKREDIKYVIIGKFRDDYPSVDAGYGDTRHRSSKPSSIERLCAAMFPCVCSYDDEVAGDNKESASKLLEPAAGERPCDLKLNIDTSDNNDNDGGLPSADIGVHYRQAPTPSAPVLAADEGQELPQHFYDRSDSMPIQCST